MKAVREFYMSKGRTSSSWEQSFSTAERESLLHLASSTNAIIFTAYRRQKDFRNACGCEPTEDRNFVVQYNVFEAFYKYMSSLAEVLAGSSSKHPVVDVTAGLRVSNQGQDSGTVEQRRNPNDLQEEALGIKKFSVKHLPNGDQIDRKAKV